LAVALRATEDRNGTKAEEMGDALFALAVADAGGRGSQQS
jgi:hypothetical protein